MGNGFMKSDGYIPIRFYVMVPFGPMKINVLFRNLLWAHGVTIKELADKTGIPEGNLIRIQRGVRKEMITAMEVRKICKALDCDINFFIDAIERSIE